MRFFVLFATLTFAATAQTIPFEPAYQPGHLREFASRLNGPAFWELKPVDGGRSGKLWFRETREGIVLLGRISGGPPGWAGSPAELKMRDHVDVWLRATTEIRMPEIAWGNQFGFVTCKTYEEKDQVNAEDCADWEARQKSYRASMERVFTRRWLMTPSVAKEEFASAALEASGERNVLAGLVPISDPRLDAAESDGVSYFEVLIRWKDFPPVDTLALSRIGVAVDFMHGDKVNASTAAARNADGSPKLEILSVARVHKSQITRCRYELDKNSKQSWYFPTQDGRVTRTFSLENERVSYRYGPEGLSPLPAWVDYFEKPIGNSSIICGPKLKYAAGARAFGTEDPVEKDDLTARSLPGGAYLLKSGPVIGTLSPFGTGQCGACPTGSLNMFYLDPLNGISKAFSDHVISGNATERDGDIQISPDWKTITIYRANDSDPNITAWAFQRYCLHGESYEPCGSGPSGPPPEPRQIQLN